MRLYQVRRLMFVHNIQLLSFVAAVLVSFQILFFGFVLLSTEFVRILNVDSFSLAELKIYTTSLLLACYTRHQIEV